MRKLYEFFHSFTISKKNSCRGNYMRQYGSYSCLSKDNDLDLYLINIYEKKLLSFAEGYGAVRFTSTVMSIVNCVINLN